MLPKENFKIEDALWCILRHSGSSFVGNIYNGDIILLATSIKYAIHAFLPWI